MIRAASGSCALTEEPDSDGRSNIAVPRRQGGPVHPAASSIDGNRALAARGACAPRLWTRSIEFARMAI